MFNFRLLCVKNSGSIVLSTSKSEQFCFFRFVSYIKDKGHKNHKISAEQPSFVFFSIFFMMTIEWLEEKLSTQRIETIPLNGLVFKFYPQHTKTKSNRRRKILLCYLPKNFSEKKNKGKKTFVFIVLNGLQSEQSPKCKMMQKCRGKKLHVEGTQTQRIKWAYLVCLVLSTQNKRNGKQHQQRPKSMSSRTIFVYTHTCEYVSEPKKRAHRLPSWANVNHKHNYERKINTKFVSK